MDIVRSGGISLIKFAPSRLRIGVQKITARTAVPKTASEAIRSGADAVLDGPMFVEPPDYRTYVAGTMLYRMLDKARGTDVPTARPDVGLTISVVGGRPVAMPHSAVAPGATVAVQLYPPLVMHGQNVASPDIDSDVDWRAGLAITSDGQLAFAIGRVSMYAFAQELQRAGALYAGYTDGGGSGKVALRDGRAIGSHEDRRVPAWLEVSSESNVPLVLGGAALVVFGGWLLSR